MWAKQIGCKCGRVVTMAANISANSIYFKLGPGRFIEDSRQITIACECGARLAVLGLGRA